MNISIRAPIAGMLLSAFSFAGTSGAQEAENEKLSARERAIVPIAALTAKGDLPGLKIALAEGLDSGMGVNDIKEVLVQMYAYCGFPRSLQGINTFMALLDERRQSGISDKPGSEASPIVSDEAKYERGKRILETLTKRPETGPKTGANAFSPEIDVFLKEHLFADIFERDILSFKEREIATIAALTALGGVEPMLRSHMGMGMNVGVTEAQLRELLSIIEKKAGAKEAADGRKVLAQALGKSKAQGEENSANEYSAFPKGNKASSEYFTGTAWVKILVPQDETKSYSVGDVTFEPGCRNNWHTHDAGQILLVTYGKGFYQEKGKPARALSAGDVVVIPSDVEHWHGAAPDSAFTHIAITNNSPRGAAVWGEKVTDEEYAGATAGK